MWIRGIVSIAGILTLIAVLLDSDLLFTGRQPFKFLRKLSRKGKRIAYGILAVAAITFIWMI